MSHWYSISVSGELESLSSAMVSKSDGSLAKAENKEWLVWGKHQQEGIVDGGEKGRIFWMQRQFYITSSQRWRPIHNRLLMEHTWLIYGSGVWAAMKWKRWLKSKSVRVEAGDQLVMLEKGIDVKYETRERTVTHDGELYKSVCLIHGVEMSIVKGRKCLEMYAQSHHLRGIAVKEELLQSASSSAGERREWVRQRSLLLEQV